MCEYIILEDFKMDKYIYDENNGIWYELQGDYYLPCLILPPEEEKPIGIWGQRHKRFLKEHRKATSILFCYLDCLFNNRATICVN